MFFRSDLRIATQVGGRGRRVYPKDLTRARSHVLPGNLFPDWRLGSKETRDRMKSGHGFQPVCLPGCLPAPCGTIKAGSDPEFSQWASEFIVPNVTGQNDC